MKNFNKKWIIYIYVIFIITIWLTTISFITNYINSNISLYESIKTFYSIYWNKIWLNEEIIINYYDNPNNTKYTNIKYFDKNDFVSRYKKNIEYSLDKWETYELSLTTKDEEYNNNLNSLNFIDLYWNTNTNKCDLNISFLKWEKNNISWIINNKKILEYNDNNVLLDAIKDENSTNKIKLYFSTWAYFNSWILVKENFIINNYNILTLSWTLWSNIYEIELDSNINTNVTNVINIKENEIKDINWKIFDDNILILKLENNIYKNRYRISDSFDYINKAIYEYKILITAEENCTFLVNWFDINNNIIKLPKSKLEWEFDIREINSKINISKTLKLNDIKLSNYLYKFY